MKRFLLLFVSILLFSSAQGQQVLNLLTGELRDGSEAAEPVVKVDTIENGYLVTYEYSEANLKQDPELPDCILWSYPGYMVTSNNGSPAFPFQNNWQYIADFAYSIDVIDSNYVDFAYQLAPAYPDQPVSYSYSEEERLPISPYQGYLPEPVISPWGIRKQSGKRYVMYTVFPIQYSYEQQIVRAYTRIKLKILLFEKANDMKKIQYEKEVVSQWSLGGFDAINRPMGFIIFNGKTVFLK